MQNLDKIAIDLSDHESLSEALSRYEVGETCDLTLKTKDKSFKFEARIDELEPEKMVLLSLTTEDAGNDDTGKGSKRGLKAPKEPVDAVMDLT